MGKMRIVITEDKRDMLFKTEFKTLFNKLTPTRMGGGTSIIYIYYDEVYDDNAVTGLLYRPSNGQLIIYPDYFMTLRMFVSSKEEFVEMIGKCYEELTDKSVRYSELWIDNEL
jgi:hypothetical protein